MLTTGLDLKLIMYSVSLLETAPRGLVGSLLLLAAPCLAGVSPAPTLSGVDCLPVTKP